MNKKENKKPKKDVPVPKGKDAPEKKEKKWFENFFNKERMKKGNKVAVVLLRDNGLADFKEVETRDEEFHVEGQMYHVDRDCMYSTQKDRIPLAIIRQWDLIPLGTKKWYDKAGSDDKMREKFAQLERHVLKGIKNIELWKVQGHGAGMNLDGKKMILYIIGAFVLGAVAIGFL